MGSVRWTIDPAPPTLWARLYVLGMRIKRDKRAFAGTEHTRRTALTLQAAGDAPPTRWTRLRCRVTEVDHEGWAVWTVRPRRRPVSSRVVYLHGGGYVHPLTRDYWRLVRSLATAGSEVVVPAYPLAPGATIDDVLPGLVALAEGGDRRPVLMGDSAGGALVLVVARRLRDAAVRTPAGVVALCPWLDAELADDEVEHLEATDPMLDESGLRAAARWWAGAREPGDPLVSPVRSDLGGLGPVDVLIGDHDILRPAVDRLAERARTTDGADLRVHEVASMFHVWMTRALPEGRSTRRMLRRLVAERSASQDG